MQETVFCPNLAGHYLSYSLFRFLNRQKASDLTAREVFAETRPFVELCIGNKPDARHVGGFNLFGKTFGNYEQDIVMSIGYHQNALTPDQLLT